MPRCADRGNYVHVAGRTLFVVGAFRSLTIEIDTRVEDAPSAFAFAFRCACHDGARSVIFRARVLCKCTAVCKWVCWYAMYRVSCAAVRLMRIEVMCDRALSKNCIICYWVVYAILTRRNSYMAAER